MCVHERIIPTPPQLLPIHHLPSTTSVSAMSWHVRLCVVIEKAVGVCV